MPSQSGIADLIGRLKKDGVDAGTAEKQRLVDAAQTEAEGIVSAARKQAEALLTGAKQERDRLQAQLDAELKMAARDFTMRMGDRIKAQVIRPVVEDSAKSVLSDPNFLKNAVHEVCIAVAKDGAGVEIAVSPEMKAQLGAYLTGELQKALKGGDVSVRDEQGLVGFRISPKGEGFSWDFTAEAVTQEIGTLVDAKLRSYFAMGDGKAGRAGTSANSPSGRASA